ncbi:MAG: hydrogenase formation protein HypD, partial [Planctomycetes bacterium]|nr:hydrogenase formation protein HypD [Planctomycetota bacterium]
MDRQAIDRTVGRLSDLCAGLGPLQIMEICGTHTVSLFRSGVKSLMPRSLRLVSGPGCPVCVTSQGYIDAACDLADRDDVTICTYGDMVRVPGRHGSLEHRRGRGARVVVVYSARDALQYAKAHPQTNVVFLAVGFETTTPPTAATLIEARREEVGNFYVLAAHKRVVPAIMALLAGGDMPIDGFLCPGHVSVIIGAAAYEPIVAAYRKPCVVAGFEPLSMLQGIAAIVEQAAAGEARVDNAYSAVVTGEGNARARALIDEVFQPGPAVWRAIGTIDDSGLVLRDAYARFDAVTALDVALGADYEPPGCRCGQVIQGKVLPTECPLFGKACTPAAPIGPCMVSSEGVCAAWYKYGR